LRRTIFASRSFSASSPSDVLSGLCLFQPFIPLQSGTATATATEDDSDDADNDQAAEDAA